MKAACVLCLLLVTGCAKQSPHAVTVVTYPLLDFFPIYIAIDLGHFRAEGVEVSLEELNQGTKIMEALVAGSADVSTDGVPYAELMAAQGRRLKVFFNSYDGNLALLVAGPSRAGSIREVGSLKGALVGIASYGGLHHRMLSFYLHRAGLKESDVRLTAVGVASTAVAAIQYGKVDAAVINGSSFRLLRKQVPGVRVLVDPRSREQAKNLFGVESFPGGSGLLATEQWLSQNPQKARQLARGMRRTLEWIHAHSAEEVLDRIPAHLRSDDREADLEHLRLVIGLLSKDGRIPVGGPEAVQRVLAASMDNVMSIELASTWTNEFLEEQKENP
jgi:NitT/TauT family transport system substrate-binding protein